LNTSSDLSSAAEDEQDDGAWPASSHESDESLREEEEGEEAGSGVKRRPDGDSEEEEEEEEGASFGWHASEAVDIEDHGLKSKKKLVSNQWAEAVEETEKERAEEKGLEETVVIHIGGGGGRRGVYKCRLCPKILCLSEETMQAHLGSKGHARSVKQLVEGKLKVQLDSDGEEEEDGETHAERNARIKATAQMKVEPVKRKRNVGHQQQRKRVKQKVLLDPKTKITAVAQDAAVPASKTTDAVHRKLPKAPMKSVQLAKRKALKTATAGTALKAAQKVSQ